MASKGFCGVNFNIFLNTFISWIEIPLFQNKCPRMFNSLIYYL